LEAYDGHNPKLEAQEVLGGSCQLKPKNEGYSQFFEASWGRLGRLWESSWVRLGIQIGTKVDKKSMQTSIKFFDGSWDQLLERFFVDLGK